jgi:type II secretory pathway component PulF
MFDGLSDRINEWWYRLWFHAKLRQDLYSSMVLLLGNQVSLKEALIAQHNVYSDNGKHPERVQAMVLEDCIGAVEEGTKLSSVLRGWIPYDEQSTIAAGEKGGNLGASLERAAAIIERKRRMQTAIVSATAYPMFLLLTLAVTFYQIAVSVMPKLLRVTKKEYWDASTYALQYLSDFVADYGKALAVVGVIFVVAVVLSLSRLTGRLRFYLDKLPPWNMYRTVQGAVFIYNVSMLLEAGIQKVEVLDDMASIATPYMRERIEGVLAGVTQGRSLGAALDESGYEFPSKRAIAYVKLIGGLEGGDKQLMKFADSWMNESVKVLESLSAVFKQVAIGFGGLLILLILIGAMGITRGMTAGL